MFDKECIPFAPSLIESMRSLGYSFQAAIADLIDNSIGANATKVKIISEPQNNPYLIIFDNGSGMSKDELYEAMRYGCNNPLEKRKDNDLGRFGLGLKSASLSQCRKLIVVSKKNNQISSFAWDLDYVVETGQWLLKGFSEEELNRFPCINLLSDVDSGTYIYLSEFDRIKAGTSNLAATFNKCLNDMTNHLALVFHRFIEDGLVIEVNNMPIESRDPFILSNPATQRLKETPIRIEGQKIILKPFILPHLSKITDKEMIKAGGRENLKTEQGFYIYRNRRLIIWGTWFRLEKKDELNKLARVRVDIPNSLDYMWAIDIKKSTATLPDMIKNNMYNAVYESVIMSESIYTFRGRKEKKSSDINYIWEKIKVRDGYHYLINRNIPQIKMLEETLDEKQKKMFHMVISSFEDSFPSAALYADYAKGNIEENITEDSEENKKLWKDLQEQIDYVKNNNLDIVKYYKMFLKVEPYCKNKDVLEKIRKEIKKYE